MRLRRGQAKVTFIHSFGRYRARPCPTASSGLARHQRRPDRTVVVQSDGGDNGAVPTGDVEHDGGHVGTRKSCRKQ